MLHSSKQLSTAWLSSTCKQGSEAFSVLLLKVYKRTALPKESVEVLHSPELIEHEKPVSSLRREELICSSRRVGLYRVHDSDYRITNCDTADGNNCEIVNCVSVRANVQ
jgi:hypothetical protein